MRVSSTVVTMRFSARSDREGENVVRLTAAVVAGATATFGFLVLQPFSVGAAIPWLLASLVPPAIYYVGTRGFVASLIVGALLVGVTILGWGSVAVADKGDMVGVYPIGIFVVTLITSLVGAAVGSATTLWRSDG